jgi:hypothetical protein
MDQHGFAVCLCSQRAAGTMSNSRHPFPSFTELCKPVGHDLAPRWFRTIYEEFEIFPLGKRERNSESGPLAFNPRIEDQVDGIALFVGVHCNNYQELITSRVQFDYHDSSPLGSFFP